MKFIYKIRYMIVACSIFIMTIILNINTFASEKTWQESYLELIDNQSHDDSSAYLLCYIDNDDIPELYMWDNVHHFYSLYTYYGECNRWSEKESMWIYNNKSGYFWSTYSTNAAYQYNIFYKLENGLCNEIYSFCIDRSEMPTEKYLINDEDVGKEEYERKMAELNSDYPLSSEFQVNGKLSQTYAELKQYLLDSMEAEPITVKGDANGDGKLAASDAAFIAKELAQSSISGEKITAEDYPSMDFNQDGKITAKDAADIARYLAEQSIT